MNNLCSMKSIWMFECIVFFLFSPHRPFPPKKKKNKQPRKKPTNNQTLLLNILELQCLLQCSMGGYFGRVIALQIHSLSYLGIILPCRQDPRKIEASVQFTHTIRKVFLWLQNSSCRTDTLQVLIQMQTREELVSSKCNHPKQSFLWTRGFYFPP